MVVTHRRGRQKGDAEGNNKADAIAKRVAREEELGNYPSYLEGQIHPIIPQSA